MIDKKEGLNTDIASIRCYVDEVIEAIMGKSSSISSRVENESSFIENLLTPIRRNPVDMLFLIQNTEIASFDRFEFELQNHPILSVDVYLEIERLREV